MPRSKKERVQESVDSSEVETSDAVSLSSDDTQSVASSAAAESSEEEFVEPPKKKETKHTSKAKVSKEPKVSKSRKTSKHEDKGKGKTDKPKQDKRHKDDGTRKAGTRKAESTKVAKQSTPKKPDNKRAKVAKDDAQSAHTELSGSSDGSDEEADYMTANRIHQYRLKISTFVKRDNMFGFVKILTESPLATVLENLHYLFVAASNNEAMIDKLHSINSDFNIVSRKFIKAVLTLEDCRHKYTESEEVAEGIQNNKPLKKIKGIANYTPEFIIMKTIQAGDLVACNMMLKKWEVVPMFAASKHLIAAFYGWEDFFSKTERYVKSQDLVVHALAGGYKTTLQRACGGSGSKWILPETLEKAALVLPVTSDMRARFDKLLDDKL